VKKVFQAFVLLLSIIGCCPYKGVASIEDTRNDVSFEVASKEGPGAVGTETSLKEGMEPSLENSTRLNISPLLLTRDFFSLSHFSRLPVNFQMTLNQILLSYELNSKNYLTVQTGRDTQHDSQKEVAGLSLSHRFDRAPGQIEAFCDSYHSKAGTSDRSEAISVGGRGKMTVSNHFEINSELAYEEMVASEIVSPSYRASIAGKLDLNTPAQSQVKIAYHCIREEPVKTGNGETTLVPESSVSSISVMNVSLACAPIKSLFMSVDYYYYLQNQAEFQTLANQRTFLSSLDFNETRQGIDEQLNFKATYVYSQTLISHLLAGWFNRGSLPYGQTDDSKTFEIRGEIVVNF
jgi:hypothetical protein